MTDDILETLLETPPVDGARDGFRTVREMLSDLRREGRLMGRDTVREKLIRLMDDGKLEVKRISVSRIDGQTTTVPGYRLKREGTR